MKGLIGFFDILGYQNFLENNSATETSLKVLDIITGMPSELKKFSEFTVANTAPGFKEFSGLIKHLVFSDTIVLTLEYPENADEGWIEGAEKYMVMNCTYLTAQMFKQGLPIRGVVHEGDFITKDACFAGRGIVEAFKLCGSLDFSGLIYSKTLAEKILHTKEGVEISNDSWAVFRHLSPMRDGSEISLLHSNWLYLVGKDAFIKCEKDVEAYVLESFWAHQKDCPNSVDNKIRNTVKVIRKMLLNINLNNEHRYKK